MLSRRDFLISTGITTFAAPLAAFQARIAADVARVNSNNNNSYNLSPAGAPINPGTMNTYDYTNAKAYRLKTMEYDYSNAYSETVTTTPQLDANGQQVYTVQTFNGYSILVPATTTTRTPARYTALSAAAL